jgi:hypothetical protein
VQLQATTRPQLEVAAAGARFAGPGVLRAHERMLDVLGPTRAPTTRCVAGPWRGPSGGLDEADLLRLSWATACLVEVFRTGKVMPGSPLTALPPDGPADLLALAPPSAVEELGALAELAKERLLPRLHELAVLGPTWLGPVFAGSTTMAADADLVVGHTLVELKTGLGRKSPNERRAALEGPTLHQLLGYVLHDHDDAHELTHVALYQARYGHFALWPLDRLLQQLAGEHVDLDEVRRRWALMLTGEGSTP